jgi:L-ribulose-5-phosphate 3-epimerase
MQISFITDEYSQNLEAACALAREFGMQAVELRSVAGKHCLDWTPAECADIRAILESNGLEPCVLDSFLFKCTWGGSEALAMERDQIGRYVELASRVGARALRVFAYWRETAPPLSAVSERISRIASECRQADLTLLVENGTYTSVAQGHELARLLDEVDMDGVAALWDPGNLRNGGWPEDPLDGLKSLGRRVGHVHVKNVHHTPQGKRYGSLNGGTVDWPRQLRHLRDQGYRGYLSLETHVRPNRTFDRSSLDFPGGYSFSAGGLDITRELAAELKLILESCTGEHTHAN